MARAFVPKRAHDAGKGQVSIMRGPKAATKDVHAHHDYSVRLAGMSAWDEHLHSFEQAQRSAAEPRALGLDDVHIIDEETGECLE
jgi:hypothetical protein